MFDIGWAELLVIGVVALIVIGPKELPAVLRTLGQSMAKIKRMAAEFQGQFQDAMREAEIADLKKQAEDLTSSVTDISSFDPMAETRRDIERAFDEPPSEAAAPAADAPPAELPPIDVPAPEPAPPIGNGDFAPAEPDAKPAGGTA